MNSNIQLVTIILARPRNFSKFRKLSIKVIHRNLKITRFQVRFQVPNLIPNLNLKNLTFSGYLPET